MSRSDRPGLLSLILATSALAGACDPRQVLLGTEPDATDEAEGSDADADADADADGHEVADHAIADEGPRDEWPADAETVDPCGAPLVAPRPLVPWNGAMTGSIHAPGSFAVLRPTFRWVAPPGAGDGPTTYDIQIDDSCTTPGFGSCEFRSPEVEAGGLADTSWRPTADLEVARTPPVGRRYYWRVRTCVDDACSCWSPVRYLDVGRVMADLDGDGFSDLVVSAPRSATGMGEDRGIVAVYPGAASGPPSDPPIILDPPPDIGANPLFGYRVVFAWDLNADGFGDLGVGVWASTSAGTPNGRALVYLGRHDGVAARPDHELLPPLAAYEGGDFGATVAGVGDVDADGYADLLVGAPGVGRAFLYSGGGDGIVVVPKTSLEPPEPPMPALGGGFGLDVAPAGDVNGDGYCDFAVGECFYVADGSTGSPTGRVFVFHGIAGGVASEPAAVLNSPIDSAVEAHFGCEVEGHGDIDDDGYGELLVGAPGGERDPRGGSAVLFTGSPAGIDPRPVALLENPDLQPGALFGIGLALAGDLDADGFDDVLVGAFRQDNGAPDEGNAFVYLGGGAGLPPVPARTLDDPGNHAQALFGGSLAGAADLNGDGYADAVVGAVGQFNDVYPEGFAFVYLGGPDGIPAEPRLWLENPRGDTTSSFGTSVF